MIQNPVLAACEVLVQAGGKKRIFQRHSALNDMVMEIIRIAGICFGIDFDEPPFSPDISEFTFYSKKRKDIKLVWYKSNLQQLNSIQFSEAIRKNNLGRIVLQDKHPGYLIALFSRAEVKSYSKHYMFIWANFNQYRSSRIACQ